MIESTQEPVAVRTDGTLRRNSLRVAVYGLGPTGVALSVLCARAVPSVTAADTDGTRVTAVKRGQSPVSDPLLTEYLTEATNDGSLRATTEIPEAAAEATVHLVAVETGIRADDAPDLSMLRATVRDISRELSAGDILVITTQVPPGTTEEVIASTVADESGLSSEEFGLAVCALPTDRSLRSIRTGDLVVAGTDGRSQTAATELFSAVTTGTVSTAPTVRTAECVDSVERTAEEMMRCLSNELAVSAPEIEVPTVAELISMRGEVSVPGPGVDGAEPVGAGFLRDAFVGRTPILDSVYTASRQFPTLIAKAVLDAVDHEPTAESDTTVLVLGVPSADDRSSADTMPVSTLIRELARAETRPLICDPAADLPRSLTPHAVSTSAANRLDPAAVVLLSFRPAFENIDWATYDDAVVIDCYGSDLDAVDADVHRLGSSDPVRNQ